VTQTSRRSDIGQYGIIPRWLLDAGISSRAVHLYAVLAVAANRDGETWPSRRTLASTLGCSPDTVDRAIAELVTAGALAVQSRFDGDRQTSNRYLVLTTAPDTRPPLGTDAALPLGMGAAPGTNLLKEPIPSGAPRSAAALPDEVQALVGGYVEDYRVTHSGHDPPRTWRAQAGSAVKRLLRVDHEDPDVLARCLGVCARESKAPSNLAHIVADYHAGKPRRPA